MMAQYQTHLQRDRWPGGAAIAIATPSTSGALMEKTRERSPAKGCSGSETNNISSSAVKMMDEKLCRQIQKVLQLPDGSEYQKGEMGKLLRLIPDLPGIYKPQNPTIDRQDALNRALVDISGCKKKGTADSLRRFVEKRNLNLATEEPGNLRVLFVRWFNRILKNKIAEIYREQKQYLSIDAPIPGGDGKTAYGDTICSDRPTGVDSIIEAEDKEAQKNLCQAVKDYLETDPEGILRKCHPKGYPQANCQELAKKRFLQTPPEKWKNIVPDLKVPYGTVTAHWKRKCVPLVQQITSKITDNFS